MAAACPSPDSVHNLQMLARDLLRYENSMLTREADLGTSMGFISEQFYFDAVRNLLTRIDSCSFEGVSDKRLQGLQQTIQQVGTAYHALRTFSPANFGGHFQDGRRQTVAELHSSYEKLFDAAAPVLALAVPNGQGLEEAEILAKDSANKLRELREQQEKSAAELQALLASSREMAQKVGVVEHAAYFASEAKEHLKGSRIWLTVTVLLSLVLVGAGGWNLMHSERLLDIYTGPNAVAPDLPLHVGVQIAIGKVFLFSLLLTASFWAGKNYRAQRHNFVINRHRQNALSSFEAFVRSAEGDTATKNTVLLQATQCIFMPQITGYVAQEGESDGVPKILEVFRAMGDKK